MNQKGKTATKKKRVVPFLNYSIRHFNEYSLITDMPETQKIVFDTLVDAIKFSVEKNKQEAEIFKLNPEFCVTLNRDKWKSSLKKAIEFYSAEDREDYEKCKQCKDLIEIL